MRQVSVSKKTGLNLVNVLSKFIFLLSRVLLIVFKGRRPATVSTHHSSICHHPFVCTPATSSIHPSCTACIVHSTGVPRFCVGLMTCSWLPASEVPRSVLPPMMYTYPTLSQKIFSCVGFFFGVGGDKARVKLLAHLWRSLKARAIMCLSACAPPGGKTSRLDGRCVRNWVSRQGALGCLGMRGRGRENPCTDLTTNTPCLNVDR